MEITGLFRFPWWRRERRLQPRTRTPSLTLIVDHRFYPTLDWSLGGCRIKGAPGTYKVGDRLEGGLDLSGFQEPGEFVAEVVRAGDQGELGLRWLEITRNLFRAMVTVKI